MKRINLFAVVSILILTFSSCQVIGDIFKAGVWVGVMMVVVVVALIIWLVSRIF